jgi:hypothetical protein
MHDDPEAENIRLRPDRPRARRAAPSEHDLGRHVPVRAARPGHRAPAEPRDIAVQLDVRVPVVAEHGVAARVEEDVVRLDVAVHDEEPVQLFDREQLVKVRQYQN